MSETATPSPQGGPRPLLEVEGLCAFYGKAQVLDDVSFQMAHESIAIVGRNGMGKTTLCNAIMGISPPTTTGSIRFGGHELVGGHSYRIARHGIGYVPQGRRLFPSLTVDEHLRIAVRNADGGGDGRAWTRDRVYELFPRLAERKRNGGGQLSGYYMWGMTPLSEAVIQGRGQGGQRQANNDVILCTGNGGMLSYHAALILSPNRS